MDLPDCPPGTEGYEDALPASAQPNLDGTKAEREFQTYTHGFKVKLQDGSQRNMFERKGRDAAGQWIYLCYPCGATCKGETIMQNHITGKKHMVKLENCKVWPLSIYSEHPYYQERAVKTRPAVSKEKKYSVLDEIINEPCALQPVLDEHKSSPLLGLEYLVELDPEEPHHVPQYHCMLCDKQGQPRSIINHLNSGGHRRRYVERYYCAVHVALGPFRSYSLEKGTRAVLHTLGTRVEQAHGRMKPLRTTHQHFLAHKGDIFNYIKDGPHISEKLGENFLEVVDKDLINFLSKDDAGPDTKKREPSPPVVAAPRPALGSRAPAARHAAPQSFQSSAQPKMALHGSTESLSSISLSSPDASPLLKSTREKREAELERQAVDVKRVRPNSPQSKGYDMVKHLKFQNKLNLLETAIERLIQDSKKKLSYHEKNPEKHPLYPEEWKNFWNRRYKELQNENKDPTKFDFKPEWIVFWTKRLKELHSEEFQTHKNDVCRRLNVPIDAVDAKGVIVGRTWKGGVRPSHIPERRRSPIRHPSPHHMPPRRASPRRQFPRRAIPHQYSPRRSPGRQSPPRRRSPPRRYSPAHSRSRYHRSPQRRRSPPPRRPRPRPTARPGPHRESRSPPRHGDRNHSAPRESSITLISDDEMKLSDNEDGNLSPWGDSDSLKSVGSASARRSPESSVSRRLVTSTGGVGPSSPEDVVSVLRVLSALEDYLGSIGSRVVDLLARALKMEKNCPNSSEELLLDEVHCILVDTAKEKLKGAVHAGLVPNTVVGAARDAITRTAALLHHAELLQKKRAEKDKAEKLKVGKEGVCVPGVGAVEKAAIAQQIAAALVAQGKSDVTTEELATLVDAVIGMANAKRNAAPDKGTIAKDEGSTKVKLTTTPSQPSESALQMLCAAYQETTRLELQEKPKQDEKRNEGKAQERVSQPKEDQARMNRPKEDQERVNRPKEVQERVNRPKEDQERVNRPKEIEDKSSMDGLSDSDLKTLLQNFKDLSSDEQHDLIGYLRKLESREPARVERLRQFVNLQPSTAAPAAPVAAVPHATAIDSEDDDYTVDEVFKSAALKVKENQMQQEMEVVQKSLQQAQPAEDATKMLASLLSSLAPPTTPHEPPTTVHTPDVESPHQPLAPATHLNSYDKRNQSETPNVRNQFQGDAYDVHNHFQGDSPDIGNNFQGDTVNVRNHFQGDTPNVHNQFQSDAPDVRNHFQGASHFQDDAPDVQDHFQSDVPDAHNNFQADAPDVRNHFQGDAPDVRNQFQEISPSYHHPNHQLVRPAPAERGGYRRWDGAESAYAKQTVRNQPARMHHPSAYKQHVQVDSREEGFERTYNERPFTQETGGFANDYYNEYASHNSVQPSTYAADVRSDGPQGRSHGLGDHGGFGQRGHRGGGTWNRSRRGGNYTNYN